MAENLVKRRKSRSDRQTDSEVWNILRGETSSESRIRELEELRMEGKSKGRKLRDTAFAKDQNDWLLVAAGANHSDLWCARPSIVLWMLSERLLPACIRWCQDIWLSEQRRRRYTHFFKQTAGLQAWLYRAGSRCLPGLKKYGMQRTVLVKLEASTVKLDNLTVVPMTTG